MENDLIHRSTALAILRALREAVGNYAPVDDIDDAIDMIQNVNAVDAMPKWISVEDEQKPRHGKEYLCVCALPNDPKHEWDWIMVLRWYSHGSNGLVDRPHFTDEGVNGMYVTHWMPRPKLPKEEA